MTAPPATARSANASAASTTIGQPPPGARPTSGADAVVPMYWRVLRLSAVRPNGWQRAVLVEGVIGVSIVLALADVASAWTIVVLPLVAMAIVKAHDYLAGVLYPARRLEPPPAQAADYATFAGIPIAVVLLRLLVHSNGGARDTSLVLLIVAVDLVVAVLVYRYLVRRGVPRGRALAIGAVTLALSAVAGILGAALEARRVRQAGEGVPGAPSFGP